MKVKIDLEKVYRERVKPIITIVEALAMEKAIRDVKQSRCFNPSENGTLQ